MSDGAMKFKDNPIVYVPKMDEQTPIYIPDEWFRILEMKGGSGYGLTPPLSSDIDRKSNA